MSDHTTPRLTLATQASLEGSDCVGTELAAMAAIANALTSVKDDAARFRVLRWAVELYAANADADSRRQDAAGDLEPQPQPEPEPEPESPPRLVGAPLRLAADPAHVVGDLQSLFSDEADDDFVGMLDEADDDFVGMLDLDAKPEVDQPVASLLEGFVKDFQARARLGERLGLCFESFYRRWTAMARWRPRT